MWKFKAQWTGQVILILIGVGVDMMPSNTSWIPSIIIWCVAFFWLIVSLVLYRKYWLSAFHVKKSSAKKESIMDGQNQQPNIHVESHNQQGGITAYQVNIQPGDRKLSLGIAQSLKDYLNKTKFKTIEVTAVMGDGEAFRFATQVKNYLESEGFTVKGVNQALYNKPMQGQIIEPPNSEGVVKIIIGNH